MWHFASVFFFFLSFQKQNLLGDPEVHSHYRTTVLHLRIFEGAVSQSILSNPEASCCTNTRQCSSVLAPSSVVLLSRHQTQILGVKECVEWGGEWKRGSGAGNSTQRKACILALWTISLTPETWGFLYMKYKFLMIQVYLQLSWLISSTARCWLLFISTFFVHFHI